MKSGRLVAILLALQAYGKQSAAALAEQLEVSVRTIYRDVEALSTSGVPIYAERGSSGGIVLADAYRDTLARFDENELGALFVSSDDVLADIGFQGDRGRALDKLVRSVPQRSRAALGDTRSRVHVDSRGWLRTKAASSQLALLRDAVWSDRCVEVAYTNREGRVTRRTLEPFGLVVKAGVWYLVARDRETVKTFRVQRITRVRVLERRFTRPLHFNVGEYWSKNSRVGNDDPVCVATLRMSRHALASAGLYFKVESRVRVRGSIPPAWLVQIAFPSVAVAVHEALSWDTEAVVVDPPDLREQLAARGRTLLARYTEAAEPR